MDIAAIATIATPVLIFMGVVITVLATRGKTQADYRSALDKRLDDKMAGYTEKLEERLGKAEERATKQEEKAEELESTVSQLTIAVKAFSHREPLVYAYMVALRNHIVNELPPPPPQIPTELSDWFDNFEDTFPGGLS